MKTYPICSDQTTHPFHAMIEHFRFIDWDQRHFIIGNFREFGFWSGFSANMDLMFPFFNTLRNWKYRKMKLEIDGNII